MFRFVYDVLCSLRMIDSRLLRKDTLSSVIIGVVPRRSEKEVCCVVLRSFFSVLTKLGLFSFSYVMLRDVCKLHEKIQRKCADVTNRMTRYNTKSGVVFRFLDSTHSASRQKRLSSPDMKIIFLYYPS